MENTGSGGFVNNTSILFQVFVGLSAGVILYLFNFAAESMMKYMKKFSRQKTALLSDTCSSEGDMITIVQNPNLANKVGGSNSSAVFKSIYMSDNERTGPEFSYSFFLNVNQSNFSETETDVLRHIFHKGYSGQYPLLSPGVYMHSAENTI